MANKIETIGGTMVYRDDYDLEVIREVIDREEYFRWGDITIKPGDLVIDCGAHIGSFTRLASSKGANVIAIEPHEDNFQYLIANTVGAKNLKLLQAVLYDGNNVLFKSDPVRNELHKVIAYATPGDDVIKSVRLDDIVKQFDVTRIDLLKMDIEGCEYEVLYNLDCLDMVQQLTMEWHYGSTHLAKLIIFLEKRGLNVVWLGGNGQWGKLQCKRSLI